MTEEEKNIQIQKLEERVKELEIERLQEKVEQLGERQSRRDIQIINRVENVTRTEENEPLTTVGTVLAVLPQMLTWIVVVGILVGFYAFCYGLVNG